MNVVCSTKGIVDIDRPNQGIMDISRAGFQNLFLDFSAYAPGGELENIGKAEAKKTNRFPIIQDVSKLECVLEPMKNKWLAEKLVCNIAYAPYLNRDTKHLDLNGLIRRMAEESIRVCGKSGIKYLVVRPIFAGISLEHIREINREYYLHLASIAKENNVIILLENQCKDIHGHLVRGICADYSMAVEWVDALNSEAGEERFGFCMDVGICNICGINMYDFSKALGNRLKAVILRDCDGNKEASMLPFTCVNKCQSQTDWLNLIRGLREIEFDGELVLYIEDVAVGFSPILRPGLVQLAKSVADYFKWQIEIESLLKRYPNRVLFGAGNMCRNYMKNYGKQYPPLYTCDNNNSIWGNEFCGLEIKSPESLRDLPDDCAIFICNIYYREIQQQLREMGIKNPIEFFNDEYMPSFYFDRVESRGCK